MRRALLSGVLVLAACETTGGKPYDYPLDAVLRFDDVQVKATHNSYHVETTDAPEWDTTQAPLDVQLDRQGVRSLELDLQYVPDREGSGSHFEVYHLPVGDQGTTCVELVDCLRTIERWSARYPGHLPLYIQMEPKIGFVADEAETYFSALEVDILNVFDRASVVTPDDLRGDAATIPAALANGWPTLDRLRGHVLFGFDNHAEVREAYTYGLTSLDGRLLFVDSTPSDPYGAVTIANDPIADADIIAAAHAAHFLVRSQSDDEGVEARADDTTRLDAALAEGATFVSTDYPVPMNGLAYVVDIPGGEPARCNPVTAPAGCTSLALEDPRFVGSER